MKQQQDADIPTLHLKIESEQAHNNQLLVADRKIGSPNQ